MTVPALTPVSVEIATTLGSKISKSGDTFPIRLAAPIVVNGKQIVAAGAEGMGEVIHAKKGAGSGAPGELVLAARYVEVDGRRLRLRSLRLAPVGRSDIGTVNAINVGGAAAGVPIGVIGFFITGGETTVPEGTVAAAKTAESFTIDEPAPEGVLPGEPDKPAEDPPPPAEDSAAEASGETPAQPTTQTTQATDNEEERP
ncbi:MAG: hypothetical protein GC201_00260 [Alphaproteobacteria bacterium]|nr:hypothetical protein [Alphaproteobacteria bacterium]